MLGVSVETLNAAQSSSRSVEEFAIWKDNVAALELFLSCRSQWRILSGFDRVVYLGLDYPAVDVVMKNRRVKDKVAMFADIQAMEWAALEVLNAEP